MARQDKVLDILALAGLPEDVKLARLVRPWLGKAFSRDQAKAIIKCYFDANGRLPELTKRLMAEKVRQEKLRNERRALADAAVERAKSPMLKYKDPLVRSTRVMDMAQRAFGEHVRQNFNDNTLNLMSLIEGEDRWYEVRWKEAGLKPVLSALIEVVTVGTQSGTSYTRYVIYRVGKRVLVARTPAHDLQGGWASQLPEQLVAAAQALQQEGYTFQTDLEGQEMVVRRPDGTELRRVPWTGQTVDD